MTAQARWLVVVLFWCLDARAQVNEIAPRQVHRWDVRWASLVDNVRRGAEQTQRHFADNVLGHLIEANRVEIMRAGQHGSAGANAQWRAGAAEYVAYLERVRARLPVAESIVISREPDGQVLLRLDTALVLVGAPRLSAQAALEVAIADDLCQEIPCAEPPSSFDEGFARHARDIRAEWEFGDRQTPRVVASDGLQCGFGDVRHLRLKQAACAQVMQELRYVGASLRAVAQYGGDIAWESIALAPEPASQKPRLIYNRQGDFFHAPLHALAQAPDLLREAIPWLQAQLRGSTTYHLIKSPEKLAYLSRGDTGHSANE